MCRKSKEIGISILFLSLLFFKLGAQNAQITRLTCRVENTSDKSLSFSWIKNWINEEEEKTTFSIYNNGDFAQSWTISAPIIVGVWYNERRFDVYLEPGDDVNVKFDGQKFPSSMVFSGIGAKHNNYLRAFYDENKDFNDRVVTNKLNELSPARYKDWIQSLCQKRLNFWTNYNAKSTFSPNFFNYALAEIFYWKAFHLIRYAYEHDLAQSLSANLSMPSNYYDFLDQVLINNDKILINSYLRKFLPLYTKYREENPTSKYGLPANQIWVNVEDDNIDLFETPYTSKLISSINYGQSLLVLDKMTFGGEYSLPIAYRLKVRTLDGREGWIKANGISIQPELKTNIKPVKIEEFTQTKRKIGAVAVVNWENLKILNEPYEKGIAAEVHKGEELVYLNQKTQEKYRYAIDSSSSYLDIFYKLKTADNKIGWGVAAGLSIVEKEFVETTSKSRISKASSSVFNNLDYFLTDKTLSYMLGKDIMNRLYFEKPSAVRAEFEAFLSQTKDEKIKIEVINLFNTLQQKEVDDNAKSNLNEVFVQKYEYLINILPARFRLDAKSTILSQPKKNDTELLVDKKAILSTNAPNFVPSKPIAKYDLVKSIISGNVATLDQNSLKLVLLTDYVNLEEKLYAIDFQKNKDFTKSIYIHEPIVGELLYGNDSIPIFLSPGDSINIEYNGTSSSRVLSGIGKSQNQILFLNVFRQFSRPFEASLKSKLKSAEPTEFSTFLDETRDRKLHFLSQYTDNQNFSNDFKSFIRAEIDYWYLFNLLNYPREHPLLNATEHSDPAPFSVDEKYYEGLKKIPFQNDKALTNRFYRYFLEEYLTELKLKPEYKPFSRKEIAEKVFTGKTLAYLKAKFIVQQLNNESSVENINEAQTFVNITQYPLLAEFVKSNLNLKILDKKGTLAPDFQLVNAKGEAVDLSQYKGKLVHIDFWAPWCSPCIEAMRKTEISKEQFSDKNIAFLYINIDENRLRWLNYVEENNLDKKRHLLGSSENPYILEAVEAYHATKLPTVILINQKGEIVVDALNRISEEQMLLEIKKLLN